MILLPATVSDTLRPRLPAKGNGSDTSGSLYLPLLYAARLRREADPYPEDLATVGLKPQGVFLILYLAQSLLGRRVILQLDDTFWPCSL